MTFQTANLIQKKDRKSFESYDLTLTIKLALEHQLRYSCLVTHSWREDVQVQTVLVHQRRIFGRAHVSDWLRTDGCPVHGVVALPASMRSWRLQKIASVDCTFKKSEY